MSDTPLHRSTFFMLRGVRLSPAANPRSMNHVENALCSGMGMLDMQVCFSFVWFNVCPVGGLAAVDCCFSHFQLDSRFALQGFKPGFSFEMAEKGIGRLIELVLCEDKDFSTGGKSNFKELNDIAAALSFVCSCKPDILLVSATSELLRLPCIIQHIPLVAFCPVSVSISSFAPVYQSVSLDCIMAHPITRCGRGFCGIAACMFH